MYSLPSLYSLHLSPLSITPSSLYVLFVVSDFLSVSHLLLLLIIARSVCVCVVCVCVVGVCVWLVIVW